jgi:hypothetical protein
MAYDSKGGKNPNIGKLMIWNKDTVSTPNKPALNRVKDENVHHIIFGHEYDKFPGAAGPNIYTQDELKKQNALWHKALINKDIVAICSLILNVKDAMTEIDNKFKIIDDTKPISGWHALRLCDIFGAKYENERYKKINELNTFSLWKNIKVVHTAIAKEKVVLGNSRDKKKTYISILFLFGFISKLVNSAIKKLNAAGLDKILYEKMSNDKSMIKNHRIESYSPDELNLLNANNIKLMNGYTFSGGSMHMITDNSNTTNINSNLNDFEILRKQMSAYRQDLKNYMFGGNPAHFDMNISGGASTDLGTIDTKLPKDDLVTYQAKNLHKNINNGNLFAKIFAHIDKQLNILGKHIETNTKTNIVTSINKLIAAENELLNYFDSGIVSLTLKQEMTSSSVENDNKNSYNNIVNKIDKIGQRETRLVKIFKDLVQHLDSNDNLLSLK